MRQYRMIKRKPPCARKQSGRPASFPRRLHRNVVRIGDMASGCHIKSRRDQGRPLIWPRSSPRGYIEYLFFSLHQQHITSRLVVNLVVASYLSQQVEIIPGWCNVLFVFLLYFLVEVKGCRRRGGIVKRTTHAVRLSKRVQQSCHIVKIKESQDKRGIEQ